CAPPSSCSAAWCCSGPGSPSSRWVCPVGSWSGPPSSSPGSWSRRPACSPPTPGPRRPPAQVAR
ncbi:MAG: hypothetical protein AVDCRST_MAG54-3487, partial [uncultured Actinomycetospora sp.]